VRLQLLLAARGGNREALGEELLRAAGGIPALVLLQLPDDPFPAANPLCRPFEAVLELEGDDGAALVRTAAPAVDALADLVHLDLSGVLVGTPQHIILCTTSRLRYLYLMRRKAGTTHEEYLDYYFHHHSRFGHRTPGIVGYTQFHCDLAASAAAARELGVGVHAIDSVSELHFEALDAFFAGTADGTLATEAGEDEARFVDRANSVSFCTVTHAP
jgi:EthD domain